MDRGRPAVAHVLSRACPSSSVTCVPSRPSELAAHPLSFPLLQGGSARFPAFSSDVAFISPVSRRPGRGLHASRPHKGALLAPSSLPSPPSAPGTATAGPKPAAAGARPPALSVLRSPLWAGPSPACRRSAPSRAPGLQRPGCGQPCTACSDPLRSLLGSRVCPISRRGPGVGLLFILVLFSPVLKNTTSFKKNR